MTTGAGTADHAGVVDWHGIERAYTDGSSRAGSLRQLVRPPLQLDRAGVLAAWGRHDDPGATVVRGVRRLPGGAIAALPTATARAWSVRLAEVVADIAAAAQAPALALGGGLDGAAILAAWRASGRPLPAVLTLAMGLPGYDEVEEACRIARQLGAHCRVIETTPAMLLQALPVAIDVAETPLYNLHPLGRWLLAREAAAGGHDVLVTGDGGDALFAGRPDHDYVPIVAALTRAHLRHATPYIDRQLIACTPRDPARAVLREHVQAAGLGALAAAPKRARLMPDLDRHLDGAGLVDEASLRQLGQALDLPHRPDTAWVTLDHLVRALRRAA